MDFLPVVTRELRVSARKRSTFWLRVVAALVALVIGAGFLVLAGVLSGFGRGSAGFGDALFKILTWLALAATLSAGLFFTADSLSEEKREGTLGFLFLTDLRGYDVAGGKLLATSLRGSYALLAFFPVLATTLLMGGVTGEEFWKTTLALIDVLFFSLAAGLLISAISWDSQKAMGGTFLLLVMVCALGPIVDSMISGLRGTSHRAVFSLSSPVYLFLTAGGWGRTPFWGALLVSNLLGWVFLMLASLFVPRTWQDRGSRKRVLSAGARKPSERLRKLLAVDPLLWLACRENWPVLMWVMALLVAACLGTSLSLWKESWRFWSQIDWLFVLALYLWSASQASRLFVETRRGGFLELILSTPLSVKEAAQSQWRALVRMFCIPLLLLLAMDFAVRWLSQANMWGALGSQTGGAIALIVLGSVAVLGTVSFAFNLVALAWFAMWMGLTSKNASLAVLKTIAFVQVTPWFIIYFLSMLVMILVSVSQVFRNAAATNSMPTAFTLAIPVSMTVVPSLLAIIKDIVFIRWARRRLFTCSREQAVWRLRAPKPITGPVPGLAPVAPAPATEAQVTNPGGSEEV